jgi:hypothetical protein
MELTINVQVSGDYTEEDLKQYLLFCMGFGSCPQDSPFINEDSDAEVSDVEFV